MAATPKDESAPEQQHREDEMSRDTSLSNDGDNFLKEKKDSSDAVGDCPKQPAQPSSRKSNRLPPKKVVVRPDERAIAADRALFFQSLAPQAPRQLSWVSYLHSTAVARQQFQARFIELFFSKDGSRFAGFDYILRSAPKSPTLMYCLDAVCLVHVGIASKDMRLREAARKTYGLAVSSLRFELANPKRSPSILLASMHVLLICELFSDIAAPDGMGARRHVRGMMQMLEYFNPTDLDPGVRALLGAQLNGVATWDAVFERKGLRGFRNLQVALSGGTTFSSATDMISVAVRVPEVLERAGKITHKGSAASVESILETINDIVAIEGELQDAMVSWYEKIEDQPYRLTAVSQIPDIHSAFNNHESVFQNAYLFKDALSASKQRSYWVLMLCLIQGRLKLCEAHPGLLILQSHDDIQRLNGMAYEYADSICMSLATDIQPENGYVALASAIFPLQIAMHWYGRKIDIPKMAWCQKILGVFEAAGMAPPRMASTSADCLKPSDPASC
ncbi:hypothetical protein M409DRAFT_19911 [Zasmidium cellare ATCC 36951]|uniref:Transcription factor domain-containing protein n=1 Tax=Zasmidium cellare ATCC 36951 TaxID=1080233 RepID=A0A6A6CWX3_ZASCE|nr:uncharacterized protein M409DRAFT_19911 [Zasmidium cellare ATCC 36951]KAF2170309.1 hypothetical protein M409DRAFT_19911 [Zasmidium cellare ATCC 36951]